jgi:hypothetical protein
MDKEHPEVQEPFLGEAVDPEDAHKGASATPPDYLYLGEIDFAY